MKLELPKDHDFEHVYASICESWQLSNSYCDLIRLSLELTKTQVGSVVSAAHAACDVRQVSLEDAHTAYITNNNGGRNTAIDACPTAEQWVCPFDANVFIPENWQSHQCSVWRVTCYAQKQTRCSQAHVDILEPQVTRRYACTPYLTSLLLTIPVAGGHVRRARCASCR